MDVQKKNAKLERRLARRIGATLIAAACGLWTLAPTALAADLPTGEHNMTNITADDIKTSTDGKTMDINQSADRAVINWASFDVASGYTVNFNHYKETANGNVPNTAAMTLNRVTGNDLSTIAGKINSVGSVILVNPHGVMFAEGSEVNAAGIVASTADIDTDKFIDSGELKFTQDKNHNNDITIDGKLTAAINGAYLADDSSYATYLKNSALQLGGRQVVTELATVGNKIMLVADGDVVVGTTGALTATTTTNVAATTRTTELGDGLTLTTNVAAQSAAGTIILRADQNADDMNDSSLATVKLKNSEQNQIQGLNVNIYSNNGVLGGTPGGLNNTATTEVASNATVDKFTLKEYNNSLDSYNVYSGKIAPMVTKLENTAGEVAYTETADVAASRTYYSLINNIYQLQAIEHSQYGNLAGTYALGTDIDASDTVSWNSGAGFNPIGSDSNHFTGTFTGDGGTGTYNIYDLTINRSNDTCVGLFAVTSGATISDVTLVDPLISGGCYVGGIAGIALNATTFTNVTMRKRVANLDAGISTTDTKTSNVTNVSGDTYVGGIVGYMSSSTITGGVNGGTVKGTINFIGGIAGCASDDATITASQNCGYYSTAEDVTHGGYGLVDGSAVSGGIVGVLGGGTLSSSSSNGQVTGTSYVGGLVGMMDGGTIKASYNTNMGALGVTSSDYGKVSGTATATGGIVGFVVNFNNKIDSVYNAGNISGNKHVGGIVGYVLGDTTISNAYNADNNTVTQNDGSYGLAHTDAEITGSSNVGGIVGFDKDAEATLTNTYVAANINDTWTVENNITSADSAIWANNGLAVKDATGAAVETPLLRAFMTGTVSTTSAESVYDGTTHSINISTDGIANIYGAVSVEGKDAGTYTATDGALWSPQHGYYIDPTPTLTITPREVGYTIDDKSKTYGNTLANTDFTLTFDDDLASDELTTEGITFTATNANGDSGLASTAGVGTYTISATNVNLGNNFVLKANGAGTNTLTINPREVGYTIANKEKTYGDALANTDFTLTFDDELAKTELTTEGLTFTATNDSGTDGLVSTAGVGTYTISATNVTLGDNFVLKDNGAGTNTLTINPREVGYTIANKEKTYGDALANTDFTLTFDDDLAKKELTTDGLTFSATNSSGADGLASTAEVGTYTISATNVDLGNNFTLKEGGAGTGTLTVKAKAIDPGEGGGGDNPGGGDTPTDPSKPSDPTEPETKPFTRENDPTGFQRYETITGSSTSTGGNASDDGLGTAATDDSNRLRTASIVGATAPVLERVQSRLLTIEETGINVTNAINAIDDVTIAPSSYASNNGGGAVVATSNAGSNVGAVAPSSTLAGYRGATAASALAAGEFRPSDLANNTDEDELKKQSEG